MGRWLVPALFAMLVMAVTMSIGIAIGRLTQPQVALASARPTPAATPTSSAPPPSAALRNRPGPKPQAPLGMVLLNQDRAVAGLMPLAESPALDEVAKQRAEQMAESGFGHYLPGHSVMAEVELLRAVGVAYTWHGENIFWATGMSDADTLSAAEAWWMDSPEHRANIEGPHYRQVGIGVFINDGRTYVVEDFTD
jgi:uncharacterized protein YkwD